VHFENNVLLLISRMHSVRTTVPLSDHRVDDTVPGAPFLQLCTFSQLINVSTLESSFIYIFVHQTGSKK